MKKRIAVAAAFTGLTTGAAHAQSSVTLYGVVDTGIGYKSSQTALGATSGGHSVVKINNGVWNGSHFRLKGSEDLGGGTLSYSNVQYIPGTGSAFSDQLCSIPAVLCCTLNPPSRGTLQRDIATRGQRRRAESLQPRNTNSSTFRSTTACQSGLASTYRKPINAQMARRLAPTAQVTSSTLRRRLAMAQIARPRRPAVNSRLAQASFTDADCSRGARFGR